MQGTCPNPACGATYNLSPQNVGGEFACRKCGAMLRVETDGLRLAGGSAAPVAAAPRSSALSSSVNKQLTAMKGRVFDWVFAVGAVLVIVFAFFPVLDQLRQARFKADMDAFKTENSRTDRTSAPNEDTRKTRDKKMQELQDNADDHKANMMYSGWWYAWGMLLGFLLLIVASIAWLNPAYSKTHRVVAAIVICTELLLVFIVYVIRSQSSLRMLD